MLSILTPAFNEAANLEALHERLVEAMQGLEGDWEWLVVDDHSSDDTFALVTSLSQRDRRVRGLRLARNSGSHVAITCGLHHVRGDAAIVMAADLQDPPETLGVMVARWRSGARVVWAVRRQLPGDPGHAGFAAAYYWVMRHIVGMKELPSRGADFFLVDRAVIEAFRQFPERHVSVFALITWLGFRQEQIEYDKRPRAAGRSGWTLARKINLVVDSVTAFSEAPIRGCAYLGVLLVATGLLVLLRALTSSPGPTARTALLLASIVGVGGLLMLAIAVVGEYVWRALEESRRRPAFLVESATPVPDRDPSLHDR